MIRTGGTVGDPKPALEPEPPSAAMARQPDTPKRLHGLSIVSSKTQRSSQQSGFWSLKIRALPDCPRPHRDGWTNR